MDAVIDLTLERYRHLLRQGAYLVDPNDGGDQVRLLFYLEHSINFGSEPRRDISRQMQFIEIRPDPDAANPAFQMVNAGPAPFLNYEPLKKEYHQLVQTALQQMAWLKEDLENQAITYAVQHLVPQHLEEVKKRHLDMIDRTYRAVKDRLTKEIAYWDHRAAELRAQEQAGRRNDRLNSEKARSRADELQGRLQRRLDELDKQRHIVAQPPVVIGGAIVIPAGLLAKLQGLPIEEAALFGEKNRDLIEKTAIEAVIRHERSLGNRPVDVSAAKLGWDIESRVDQTGKLRFIEVKGRIRGAQTITVSKNEILAALNKPDDYFLAVVEVHIEEQNARAEKIHYIQRPFQNEPDFAATSVNFDLSRLLKQR